MSFQNPASIESDASGRELRMRRVMGSAEELTMEVLRLLVLYPHDEEALRSIGVSKEETAARLCETLPRPGGMLMTADDGHRLQGLLYLEPMLGPSAAMGMHAWNVGPLVIAPDVPGDTVATMLEKSLAALSVPADFITARVPSADGSAISGLQKSGFEVVSGEAVAVAKPPGSSRIQHNDVDFALLDPEHLEAALEIACDCMQCNSFACNQGFDRNRVCKCSRLSLRPYIYEKDKKGLVALDSDGEVIGFAAYSFDADIKTPPTYGVGSMDQLCVSADGGSVMLERLLGRKVLNELFGGGVETVITKTLLNETGARVESLKKIGFEVTHSNLVMRRWSTRSRFTSRPFFQGRVQ